MAKFLQNLLHRFTHKNFIRTASGQHSIEYAVLLIVVMAAIIIAGRYIIRAWNANMQTWEESAIDSLLDPMIQAPNINLGPCVCDFNPAGCGPLGGCPEDQQFHRCECMPLGCGMGNPTATCPGGIPEGSGQCICDVICCTVPVPTGACGPPACPLGQMQVTFICGCGAPLTGCMDHPDCRNDCIPPISVPLNSIECPGYEVNLAVDTNNSLWPDCSGAPADNHCQLTCEPPYIPSNFNATYGWTMCGLCPAGRVLQGTCAAGQCDSPGFCAAGQCSSG